MGPLLRVAAIAAALLACVIPQLADAQPSNAPRAPQEAPPQTPVIGVISGGIGGTYIRIASDLAAVLDDGDNLRILPMIGKGSVQNIADLLTVKGIDVAIVQSDVLSYLKRQSAYRNIDRRIRYITKLYNEEFHLVAGSGINSIKDLAGKKVNFDVEGSGTDMTATTVFEALGIKVVPQHFDQALAMQKVKSGEIAAAVYVAGKPAKAISDLKADGSLKLLSIPFSGALQETYLPATFTSQDYPGLVEAAPVDTIAIGAVMAVVAYRPGSEPYKKLAGFVETFFSHLDAFQNAPRHPKWHEVSLAAELPGWKRFEPSRAWLAVHRVLDQPEIALRQDFGRFVESLAPGVGGAALSKTQQEALFQEFRRWQRSH